MHGKLGNDRCGNDREFSRSYHGSENHSMNSMKGDIEVGDGYWRQNVFMTSLRC